MKAFDVALIFGADGQNVTVIAHGDDAVLQDISLLPRQIFGQPGADSLVEEADFPANGVELVAGIVAHFRIVENFGAECHPRAPHRNTDCRQAAESGGFLLVRHARYARMRDPRRAEQVCHAQQLAAGKSRTFFGPFDFVRKGRKIFDFPDPVGKEEFYAFLRQLEALFYLGKVGLGRKAFSAAPCFRPAPRILRRNDKILFSSVFSMAFRFMIMFLYSTLFFRCPAV